MTGKSVLGVAVGAFTIVGAIFTAMMYFDRTPDTVKADGGIAAGGNIEIEGDVRLNQFDFDEEQRDQAARYVSDSIKICGQLASRVESQKVDSSVNPMNMTKFHAMELYPPEQVAEVFGEEVYVTITEKLDDISVASQGFLGILGEGLAGSMMTQLFLSQDMDSGWDEQYEKTMREAAEAPGVDPELKAALESLANQDHNMDEQYEQAMDEFVERTARERVAVAAAEFPEQKATFLEAIESLCDYYETL